MTAMSTSAAVEDRASTVGSGTSVPTPDVLEALDDAIQVLSAARRRLAAGRAPGVVERRSHPRFQRHDRPRAWVA
jgi:hypothetical protein